MKNKIMLMAITTFIIGINATSYAETYYSKEGGVSYQTVIGTVESVNPKKDVFVVTDKDSGRTTTILTDSTTIATLHQGQTARVKLRTGSPFAESVMVGN